MKNPAIRIKTEPSFLLILRSRFEPPAAWDCFDAGTVRELGPPCCFIREQWWANFSLLVGNSHSQGTASVVIPTVIRRPEAATVLGG
jgi:hypothetical protein